MVLHVLPRGGAREATAKLCSFCACQQGVHAVTHPIVVAFDGASVRELAAAHEVHVASPLQVCVLCPRGFEHNIDSEGLACKREQVKDATSASAEPLHAVFEQDCEGRGA